MFAVYAIATIGTIFGFVVLVIGIGMAVAAARMNERWPDEDPTLDVQNKRGDTRPLR